MKIAISGASGLVGSALIPFLERAGQTVIRLVRARPGQGQIGWDPETGRLDVTGLEGVDAVIHLAGEPIGDARWTESKKARIRSSRVDGTRLLAESLARLDRAPRVMICASAVGYYGNRGDERLTEASPPGEGFLPEVCQAWEAAAEPARQRGMRVVHLRLGLVLSATGGALKRMLLPFRLGLGGRVGSGRQYVSWIAIDDLCEAVRHVLAAEALEGPVNVVSPQAVTNQEFTRVLGRVLHRPTPMPMPAWAARLAFGEMADALLLSSLRVEPRRLLDSGFAFRYPDLRGALEHVLGQAER